MKDQQIKKISKFLSLVLRHKPETIGITLDENGWVDTNELLEKLSNKNRNITFLQLEEVVEKNNKKRFAFNETRTKIRASQGHSLSINLNYKPVEPPEILYHGTATRFIESIKEQGLLKRNRDHVHLSHELDTAITVGKRHGKIKVLHVKAKEMFDEGYKFYFSDNGVWLTDHVPTNFIDFIK